MTPLQLTLRAHLAGYNIPRYVIQRVWEAIKLFDGAPVGTAYYALPQLKIVLDEISRAFPSLTLKQRIAVQKSYHVIKYGNNEVQLEFLQKDLTAMGTPEPVQAVSGIQFLRHGLSTISYDMRFGKSKSIVPVAMQQVVRNSNDGRPFSYSRLGKKIKAAFASYDSLPPHLKTFRRWAEVFGDHNVTLKEFNHDPIPYIGSVSVTFEQGMKPRLFASPLTHFQAFLEPLKRSLQKVCSNIPEDFHGDQHAGRVFVQEQLTSGKTAHCYDLSSATHLFPWSVQLKMLRIMGVPQDLIQIMDYCSKGVWRLDIGHGQPVTWSAGQPLGLGPSFFIFSLAHHLIVRGIFHRMGLSPSGEYAILGDDIVIFNNRVARAYTKVMKQLGCSINMNKSVVSDEVAEFAGATITKTDIILVGKFRKLTGSNRLMYNMRWDKPEPDYNDVVSFLKDPYARPFESEFVRRYVGSKTNKILSLVGIEYPSHCVKKLNTWFGADRCGLYFTPEVFDENLKRAASQIVSIFEDCPECFPEATTPHYISSNMQVLIGLQELCQAAIEDNDSGFSTPIWFSRLMECIGCEGEEFSVPKLIRCCATFLLEVCFSTTFRKRTAHNRYQRVVKQAIRKYNTLMEEGGVSLVISETVNLSRFSGIHPDFPEAVSDYVKYIAHG